MIYFIFPNGIAGIFLSDEFYLYTFEIYLY